MANKWMNRIRTNSLEDDFEYPNTPKVIKDLLWTSRDKRTAIVTSPFPQGFSRSLAYSTIEKAKRTKADEICPRPALGARNGIKYARVWIRDVQEARNEWGEITP